MLSAFRYSSVAFFFFPLVIAGVWAGGHWPQAYLLFAVGMYVAIDNLTPPLTSTQSLQEASPNNLYLFLQVPLSILLIGVYLAKVGLMTANAGAMQILTIPLMPFSSVAEALVAAFAIGVHCGSNFVVAHELMHRASRFWKTSSRILLVISGDAQFQEAHLYGHHSAVGTSADPATARRGESFYRFLIRSIAGQWKGAYAFERARLRKRNAFERLIQHRVLRGNLATLVLLGGVAWFCGVLGVVGYLLIMFVAKSVLEAVNYIQHYGLTRKSGTRVGVHHSWECDSRGSSMFLYNLTRHAEHHLAPRKPFWELHVHRTPYRLPHGYMFAIVVAMIPPLWFRYSDRLFEAASRPALHSSVA